MKSKLYIFVFALIGNVLLYILFNSKETGLCKIYCGPAIDQYQDIFLFFPVILFFSLVTFKMHERVFVLWWKFAQFAIPTIFFLLALINFGILHGGTAGTYGEGAFYNQIFDFYASLALYLVFVLGSMIQIVRGYRKR